MKVGDTLSWRRTFTEEDIRLFTTVSGDGGEHHLVPDAKGRLMAHGLLTATLPTKIGGDMNLIASEMFFRFHRPVFSGDTIECVVTLIEATPTEDYLDIYTEWRCTNQHGKEVMTGGGRGLIRDRLE
ncbi:MAG TPA: MaoC family dehydratase N-terminal domain-containing protein [Pyrinomonadaceae bacterium]|nr:MaoC family dehydratase N-terminal domain-containing protein [Pyrinomonadaceae bacterium]